MPLSSKKLHRARAAKNDEFYTQYDDVKKECDNYLSHFFNKTIYCNCDTADSAFVRYFTELKSAGLIRDIWFSGGLGGADFRSPESVSQLQQADIVVTNPPFSLFRPFIELLIQYNKKFLIVANMNSVMYKTVFSQIKENKMWVGTRVFGGNFMFDVPNQADLTPNGNSIICVRGINKVVVPATWLTNLEFIRPRPLILNKRYYGNEDAYPTYDNADAINVNRKTDIPCDYKGVIGVPITFLDRYTPERFLLLGLDKDFTTDGRGVRIAGRPLYTRLFIRLKS